MPVEEAVEVKVEAVPVVEEAVVEVVEAEPVVETVEEETTDKLAEDVVVEEKAEAPAKELNLNKPYEEMTIEELQASIIAKMAKNGPVTDEMRRTVEVNNHQGSLLNWVRSFN